MATGEYSAPVWIELDRINPRPASEMRASVDEEAIESYSENFDALPPIKVMADTGDVHWCVDGSYRLRVAERLGKTKIRCVIKRGTYLDAFGEASHSNTEHGVRITNEDKRQRLKVALSDPVMGTWTQRRIADHCGFTPMFVSKHDNRVPSTVNGLQSTAQISVNGAAFRPDDRTNEQKWAEVQAAFREHPDWNNQAIVDHCRVSRDLARKVRASLDIPPAPNTSRRAPAPAEVPSRPPSSPGPPASAPLTVLQLEPEPEPAPVDTPSPEPEEPDWDALVAAEAEIVRSRFEAFPAERRGLFIIMLRDVATKLAARCPNLRDRSRESFA